MNHTLVALFDDMPAAMRARTRLVEAGFADRDIDVHATDVDRAAAADLERPSSGGLDGWLRALFGMKEHDAHDDDLRLHREALERGAVMLSLEAGNPSEAQRAADLLQACGAMALDDRSGPTAGTGMADGGAARAPEPSQDRRTLPIVEEELAIGKWVVQLGGVRVISRVVTEPVEEQVRLRQENAEVRRRPVDRPATEADFQAMKDGTIEIRESAEEPVVSRRARVTEEVEIGKRVSERTETVRDSVRHTEVRVDDETDAGRREREHAAARRDRTAAPGDSATRDVAGDPPEGRRR